MNVGLHFAPESAVTRGPSMSSITTMLGASRRRDIVQIVQALLHVAWPAYRIAGADRRCFGEADVRGVYLCHECLLRVSCGTRRALLRRFYLRDRRSTSGFVSRGARHRYIGTAMFRPYSYAGFYRPRQGHSGLRGIAMSEPIKSQSISRRRLFWLAVTAAALGAPATMLSTSDVRAQQSDQAPAAEPTAPKTGERKKKKKTKKKATPGATTAPPPPPKQQ